MRKKRNINREDYKETRKTGYIKNYKAVRHKEAPNYKKSQLENIDPTNIKRPYKFTDAMDTDTDDNDNDNDNNRKSDNTGNT